MIDGDVIERPARSSEGFGSGEVAGENAYATLSADLSTIQIFSAAGSETRRMSTSEGDSAIRSSSPE